MCQTCEAAMAAVTDRGDGATAHAWDRADAAIKAWRKTLPEEVEFEGVMEESVAWATHMAETTAEIEAV